MDSLKKSVQTVVNEIYSELGEVRPSVLVEKAKPKYSLIHDAFEWDNRKAGDEYRLIQARQWIRRVEYLSDNQPSERFVHVPYVTIEDVAESRENFYKPISVVVQDQDEYDLALSETLADLKAAKKSYADLKAAAPLSKIAVKQDFRKADRGFEMVESALIIPPQKSGNRPSLSP